MSYNLDFHDITSLAVHIFGLIMIPYSSSLMLDSSNNYGIVKTEAVFGFNRDPNIINLGNNISEPMEWLIRPLPANNNVLERPRSFDAYPHQESRSKTTKRKKLNKRTGKGKKCVFKIMNKDKKIRGKRRRKIGMKKKFVMPLIIGLLAAKSILIPIALKALAFISAKGFLMGFFSTILASFLSLKGMFDHNHRYQDRKDEKTQVEIIQVPPPKDEHHYYNDYKRGDYVPFEIHSLPLTPYLDKTTSIVKHEVSD